MRSLLLAIFALVLAAAPARACALALLFALDVSASVDAGEYRLQRDGLAAALVEPAIVRAVVAQPGGVALAAYEWSGRRQQSTLLAWTRVSTAADLVAVADRIGAATRSFSEFPTAIGYALGHGAGLMRDAPDCTRRVIDISGDGVGNEGFGPAAAYREFPFEGITVNGLVVSAGDGSVIEYYGREVLFGPDAFLEVAESFDGYARAMRRKLLRELYGAQVARKHGPPEGVRAAAGVGPRPSEAGR